MNSAAIVVRTYTVPAATDGGGHMPPGRPNILLLVSDQERQRGWIPDGFELPNRQRLIDEGIELTNHYTHSSPCSPSRATLMTGMHVPQHGVPDNVIHPHHSELSPGVPTIGSTMRAAGYRSSYIGKWHLAHGAHPDMEAYGYSDWDGNDLHFMGWAGTGAHFDPVIASNAASWLDTNVTGSDQPWFLTVALVNPHDIVWFPIDQPWYQDRNPDEVAFIKSLLEAAAWKEGDTIPPYTADYPEIVDELPASFEDDLLDKPACHRQWRWDQQHGAWGTIDPDDPAQWLRNLDYYLDLHRRGDENLGLILHALDRSGAAEDTVVIFTSDHGDMAGSHGLRSKGPFVYEEIMNVPLYVRWPGVTQPGSVSSSLSSAVDLFRTICSIGGAEVPGTVRGVDQSSAFADPATSARDHVLFCHDSAHQTVEMHHTRYAIRGVFDGQYKYAHYYGVKGGKPTADLAWQPSVKLYPHDARFEDQEHELYDLDADPHEMVNLAMDMGRRDELRKRFAELRALEEAEFGD
ncbi:MAG TPA: sulfatase-like hydrolase/transferase [Acidimicrobiales bacterium]